MGTFIPITSFVSSPETERERFLCTTASIASGFYYRHEFMVLSSIVKVNKSNIVILPQLPYKLNLKYWIDAKKAGLTMPLKLTKLMWNESKNFKLTPVNQNNINLISENWKRVEKYFWHSINTYFPKEKGYIKKVEIRITKIGSSGSHYLLNDSSGQKLVIYIREDLDYSTIADLIVLALIYPTAKDLDLSFTQRTAIKDFIVGRKEFIKLFPGWKNKKTKHVKLSSELRSKSLSYIKSLGIPDVIDPFLLISKNISIFGIKEEKLLNLLIDNKNELVTYDQIANCIWGEGEFKSYWAINKLVQRVLKKINLLEIDVITIIGVHGKGYVLNSGSLPI